MKKLVIHIGTHKTGTTSLQKTLSDQRGFLQKSGIYYPMGTPYHSANFYPIFVENNHENYFYRINGITSKVQAQEKTEKLKKFWAKEFNKYRDSNCETFVIVSEHLELLKESEVQRMKAFVEPYFDEINVVVYFREARSYIISAVQESVKFGNLTLDEVSEYIDNNLDYKRKLGGYVHNFGSDSVIVKVFNRKYLKNGDIVDDFLDTIGYKDLGILQENRTTTNVSLGLYSVIMLSEYNKSQTKLKGTYKEKEEARRIFIELSKKIEEPKFVFDIDFTEGQIRRINEQYAYINEFIIKENCFDMLEQLDSCMGTPNINDIPANYLVDLVHEYDTYIVGLNNQVSNLNANIIELEKKYNNKIKEINNRLNEISKQANGYKAQKEELINSNCMLKNNRIELEKVININNTVIERKEKENNKRIVKLSELEKELTDWTKKDYEAQKRINKQNQLILNLYSTQKNKWYIRLKNYIYTLFNRTIDGFDEAYYFQTYSEVRNSKMKAFEHYIKEGVYQCYNPNKDFNTKNYILNHLEILQTGENAFIHSLKEKK